MTLDELADEVVSSFLAGGVLVSADAANLEELNNLGSRAQVEINPVN